MEAVQVRGDVEGDAVGGDPAVQVLALEPRPVRPPSRSVSALTWRPGPAGPELLVMLRRPDQGLWWSSVTGMIEPGETPEAAAHRELLEETGLTGTLTSLGFSHSFWMDPRILGLPPGEPRYNTELCFQMEVAPEARVQLALDEHTEYRWCGFAEARDLMLWEGSKAALDLLGRKLVRPVRAGA